MESNRREDLIESYLKGSLTTGDQSEFNKLMKEDPSFKAEVEAQTHIVEALKILEEKDQLSQVPLPDELESREEAPVIAIDGKKWLYYAVAASLTIAVLTFAWLFAGDSSDPQFFRSPIYDNDGSLGFVKPSVPATDSTVVAIYSSDDQAGTYTFSSDTLKIYISNLDVALDMYILHDPETDRYTLDLSGRKYLLEKSASEKKLIPLTNER